MRKIVDKKCFHIFYLFLFIFYSHNDIRKGHNECMYWNLMRVYPTFQVLLTLNLLKVLNGITHFPFLELSIIILGISRQELEDD